MVDLCRAMRHYLGSGLTLRDVFRQQAKKGTAAVRPIAGRVSDALEQGSDLEAALQTDRDAFPPIFLSLASVGERSGKLPEICHELEKYFLLQQRLRRQFLTQITWPLLQFFGAIFVIAGMIYLIGILTPLGSKPFDPLGFGLTGETGALTFLGLAFGFIALMVGLFFGLRWLLRQQGGVAPPERSAGHASQRRLFQAR